MIVRHICIDASHAGYANFEKENAETN